MTMTTSKEMTIDPWEASLIVPCPSSNFFYGEDFTVSLKPRSASEAKVPSAPSLLLETTADASGDDALDTEAFSSSSPFSSAPLNDEPEAEAEAEAEANGATASEGGASHFALEEEGELVVREREPCELLMVWYPGQVQKTPTPSNPTETQREIVGLSPAVMPVVSTIHSTRSRHSTQCAQVSVCQCTWCEKRRIVTRPATFMEPICDADGHMWSIDFLNRVASMNSEKKKDLKSGATWTASAVTRTRPTDISTPAKRIRALPPSYTHTLTHTHTGEHFPVLRKAPRARARGAAPAPRDVKLPQKSFLEEIKNAAKAKAQTVTATSTTSEREAEATAARPSAPPSAPPTLSGTEPGPQTPTPNADGGLFVCALDSEAAEVDAGMEANAEPKTVSQAKAKQTVHAPQVEPKGLELLWSQTIPQLDGDRHLFLHSFVTPSGAWDQLTELVKKLHDSLEEHMKSLQQPVEQAVKEGQRATQQVGGDQKAEGVNYNVTKVATPMPPPFSCLPPSSLSPPSLTLASQSSALASPSSALASPSSASASPSTLASPSSLASLPPSTTSPSTAGNTSALKKARKGKQANKKTQALVPPAKRWIQPLQEVRVQLLTPRLTRATRSLVFHSFKCDFCVQRWGECRPGFVQELPVTVSSTTKRPTTAATHVQRCAQKLLDALERHVLLLEGAELFDPAGVDRRRLLEKFPDCQKASHGAVLKGRSTSSPLNGGEQGGHQGRAQGMEREQGPVRERQVTRGEEPSGSFASRREEQARLLVKAEPALVSAEVGAIVVRYRPKDLELPYGGSWNL